MKRRISRFHYTDLLCAAMNCPATKVIFDKMEAEGFEIVEDMSPEESRIHDYSICLMYPHQIDVAKILA
jgi:hypothetical protein